jgi:hypothetical protein
MKKILLFVLSIALCLVTITGIIAFFYNFEPSIGGLVFVSMLSAVGFTFAYLVYSEGSKEILPIESPYSTVEQRLAWYKKALSLLINEKNQPYICVILMYNDTAFYQKLIKKKIKSHELLPELHAWRTEFNNGTQWFRSKEERITALKTVIKQLS